MNKQEYVKQEKNPAGSWEEEFREAERAALDETTRGKSITTGCGTFFTIVCC